MPSTSPCSPSRDSAVLETRTPRSRRPARDALEAQALGAPREGRQDRARPGVEDAGTTVDPLTDLERALAQRQEEVLGVGGEVQRSRLGVLRCVRGQEPDQPLAV